jgi:hypothetical protein
MSQAKQAPKRKHRSSKAVPVLGAAGLLSMAGGASAATGMPAADLPVQKVAPTHEITLGEEELSDVSLATFYAFDKENAADVKAGIQVARGCGRCGGCGGRGCGGRGCGGRGCGCGGRGCRCGGCGCWGGCGCGCCLSWGGCGIC